MNALADRLLSRRASLGAGATINDPATQLGTDELLTAASEHARLVERVGRKSSPVVAVTLPLSTDALVMLVAAITADHTICFLDPSAPEDRLRAITAVFDPMSSSTAMAFEGPRRNPGQEQRSRADRVSRGTSRCRQVRQEVRRRRC